ncbi:MAG: hypothetical protein WD894_07340 [Pirellulales bacterium]
MRVRALIIILLSILVPLCLYLGAYFALLKGRLYEPIGVNPATRQNLFLIHPEYRTEGSGWILYPVHLLDRRIRRDYWTQVLPTD